MPRRVYATIGRAPDNDVVLDHPTVSNHHARLSWSGGSLIVEDLSSANGTFVDGQQVTSARTRPGAELRMGQVLLPWSHEGLRLLLKAGAGARTLVMPQAAASHVRSYVCGACGRVGELPPGPLPKRLTCAGCNKTLRTGTEPRGSRSPWGYFLLPLLGVAPVLGAYFLLMRPGLLALPGVDSLLAQRASQSSSEEQAGGATARAIARALTPMDPLTRDTAIKIAASTQGPFHVEQVAEIWNTVRRAWRYVSDPEGQEYFATATETIQNGYIGDCDDFAIVLASMVSAIGGKARVVLMDGPGGGHAYAEACVQGDPKQVAAALTTHYRNRWRSYLNGKIPTTIAYRTSTECPIWLNLDWNSVVPGGAYQPESLAIAIYGDGHSETLAPAAPAPAASSQPPKSGSARPAAPLPSGGAK